MTDEFQISKLSELAVWLRAGRPNSEDAVTCRRAVLEFQLQRERIAELEIQAEAQAARIAEVDARVAEARRAGLEEAVKWHEERALKLGQEASLARNFRQLLGKSDFHLCSAAAIRALEGKKND
jgi:hypothetical protein